jgi:type IV pilus assembly protein PilQ
VPYQESSLNGATTVVFKKAVLSLKVTPQILPDNKILLQLQVNQDRPSNHEVLGVPTISTRQISTNVLVQNGHTVVLGGIYETSAEHSEEGLPFISKIPIVGLLFKQQDTRKRKRELLIFVTPKMV